MSSFSSRISVAAAALCAAFGVTGPLAVEARGDETVMVCSSYGNQGIFGGSSNTAGIEATSTCPGNIYTWPNTGGLAVWAVHGSSQGQSARLQVNAPAGLIIQSVYIPEMYSYGVDDGLGYGGGLYWQGGSQGVQTWDGESGWSSSYTGSPVFTWPAGGSSYFGVQLICGVKSCAPAAGIDPKTEGNHLALGLIQLRAHETIAPWIGASGSLWSSSGWIRGDFSLQLAGDSPTGVCTMSATLGGQPIPDVSYASGRNAAVWHQCSGQPGPITVHTADSAYGNGTMQLELSGVDAAGVSAANGRTVQIDNTQPQISLSGPTDAPSSAGTQYITATATAGPSLMAGIGCSLDGAPNQWYAQASVQIPVGGVGDHSLTCYSANNARDASGELATSPPATWALSIRQPSVSTVSFARVVDALRCAKMRERVRVPAHWVTARYRGRPIAVKLPAQTRTIAIVQCHPRVVRKRVYVPAHWVSKRVRIHGQIRIRQVRVRGHWMTSRVALVPRVAQQTAKRIPYGQRTTISGWLGTTQGAALGGQQVWIVTAPDNGQRAFRAAAVATTAPDGSWTATLPPGPSRLVAAEYGGDSTVEPSSSAPARAIVPASASLRIRPGATHWGGKITISGRLRGGYVPPAGELVVLWVGWPGGSTEIGHVYTQPDGRFNTTYTFLRGNGTETYSLWAETAAESDYPYAPGRSRKVNVTVGP